VNIQPASRNLIDSIPSSNTDALLRERGFDLLYEYLQIINEARFPPGRIIELATGTGRTSAIFARQGFEVVTGDIRLAKRSEALRRISPAYESQVSMMVLNMEKLPFRDNSVPAVISLNTIHELEHPEQCLLEMLRIHDPAGVLVVGDFNTQKKARPKPGLMPSEYTSSSSN
jgi:ubiquinone/menaquinone biosynthesis C-methylase UbiE